MHVLLVLCDYDELGNWKLKEKGKVVISTDCIWNYDMFYVINSIGYFWKSYYSKICGKWFYL